MNFSGISNRSVIGKLLRLPLRLVPGNAVVPILQGPMRGYRWIAGSSSHGCWLGSYEFQKQQAFIRQISPGQVVYDIGAHVGFYTLLSSILVGESGHVVAFEPYPPNVEMLRRHMTLNGIGNVTIVDAAVSHQYGVQEFQIAESTSEGQLLRTRSTSGSIQVRVISLDRYIEETDLPRPDIMKIDIEGEEFNLLQGAAHLLETHTVGLFLATHGAEIHQACLRFLRERDFTVSSLDSQSVETTSELFASKGRSA